MIEKFISEVLRMIYDGRYYYSQNRENEFAVDCSWLLIRALASVGIPVNGATYTGNMVKELSNTGKFLCMPFNIQKAQRGDIFVKHISGSNGHAVLYLGNNKIAEACNKKYGLRETNYYFNGYQYMLRLKEVNEKAVSDLPTLRRGDKNIYVGFLQIFLNKYCGCKLVIDCDFGQLTFEAVKGNLQAFHNLECDGIVGVKTWAKIYGMMVQS